ncbi:MAG: hypothetical protein SCH71_11675 [Desulfobulbaceae bacterium]|nr:hypothetical protein [Desulfobulbaceae bacterium]
MKNEDLAQKIMTEYGERTGLLSAGKTEPRRYLWTDAFAVCNYIALARLHGQDSPDLAARLVDQVHEVLGRRRPDDPRQGRLSGLEDQEGRQHPTAGGLRIGKKMPERRLKESFDESLEWERDGQYYHYLTKWMHALCCFGSYTNNTQYLHWAAELAERGHAAFSYGAADGSRRLYWKMSIDLSRPQVSSMGHHDPLDGLITCVEITGLCALLRAPGCRDLADPTSDLADMCRGVNWATTDPLGLGTLLADAWRLAQFLPLTGEPPLPGLLTDMLEAAVRGLSVYARDKALHLPAAYRLAFRELGLAIGLQAIPRIESLARRNPDIFPGGPGPALLLAEFKQYQPLQEQILHFWLNKENREVPAWTEHADINMVMLATCLVPDGFLDIQTKTENRVQPEI